MTSFGSNYGTPGWQRAQAKKRGGGFSEDGAHYGDDDDAYLTSPLAGGAVSGRATG